MTDRAASRLGAVENLARAPAIGGRDRPSPRPWRELWNAAGQAGGDFVQVSPPGVIGGAVIWAARRSARLSRRRLARMLAVDTAVLRGWEAGIIPLFCVRYEQLRQLAGALHRAGAGAGTVLDELFLASQCDLLITGMLSGSEDYADVPPIDDDTPGGARARELLRWAFQGTVPGRYRGVARAGHLLASPDRLKLAAIAGDLRACADNADLAGYASALSALLLPVSQTAS